MRRDWLESKYTIGSLLSIPFARLFSIFLQHLLVDELQEIEVEVWSYEKCRTNITTLFHKALCIYMYEPCLLLNGGEPLICDGMCVNQSFCFCFSTKRIFLLFTTIIKAH